MKRWLAIAAAIVVVGVMAAYLLAQRDVLDALLAIDVRYVVALIAVGTVVLGVQAKQYQAALSPYAVRIGYFESVGLTAVNTMANYYVPARGGAVVRAAYMLTVHAFPLASYAVVVVAMVVAGLAVAIAVGLIAAIGLAQTSALVSWQVPGVFAAGIGALVLLVVLVFFFTKIPSGSGRVSRVLQRVSEAIVVMGRSPASVLSLAVWSFGVLVFQTLRLWVAFAALGENLTVIEITLISALAAVSFVLSITPGNLGIKEGVTALAASLVGIDVDVALAAALLDRGAALVVTFGVGIVALPTLTRRAGGFNRASGESGNEHDSLSTPPDRG